MRALLVALAALAAAGGCAGSYGVRDRIDRRSVQDLQREVAALRDECRQRDAGISARLDAIEGKLAR